MPAKIGRRRFFKVLLGAAAALVLPKATILVIDHLAPADACLIRIDNEVMKVVARNGKILTVVRGYGGTVSEPHRLGTIGLDQYQTEIETEPGLPSWATREGTTPVFPFEDIGECRAIDCRAEGCGWAPIFRPGLLG